MPVKAVGGGIRGNTAEIIIFKLHNIFLLFLLFLLCMYIQCQVIVQCIAI